MTQNPIRSWIRFLAERPRLARLLSIAVVVKITTLLLIAMTYALFPFCKGCFWQNFVHDRSQPIGLATAYQTWDAQHYLHLADGWYAPGAMSNAFYPLYPALVKILRPLFLGNTLLAGLTLSHICFSAALVLLFVLVQERWGEEAAFRAGILFLCFPTAYYTSLVYTESLFILLVTALFLALSRGSRLAAGAAALLLPLTRPHGILIAAPLIWSLARGGSRGKAPAAVAAVCLLIGFGVYAGVMAASLGDPLAGFETQKLFASGYAPGSLLHPVDWFRSTFLRTDFALYGTTNSLLDRIFFVLFLLILVPVARRTGSTELVYCLALGLIGPLAGSFMSYMRYLLPLFPIYVALAFWLKDRYVLLAIPMAALQVFFLIGHSINYFIA